MEINIVLAIERDVVLLNLILVFINKKEGPALQNPLNIQQINYILY